MTIRWAEPKDVPTIIELIKELAIYEKAEEEAVAAEEQIHRALFGEGHVAFCHVVEADNAVVGFALWILNYSTWLGEPGIYLEDLYVRPEFRGQGFGLALLKELARICVERGYPRFQWWVLDWNTPAIDFYKAHGAVPMDEWTVYRLSGEALKSFGGDI